MLKDYEQIRAFNLNLELKPISGFIPDNFKVRRLTQEGGNFESTVSTESRMLYNFFENAALSAETRSYVVDLLNESVSNSPEMTLKDLRRSLKKLPKDVSQRPEFVEALKILLG